MNSKLLPSSPLKKPVATAGLSSSASISAENTAGQASSDTLSSEANRCQPAVSSQREVAAARIVLRGRVQGAGIRPAVARWANVCSLCGSVRNTGEGVEIDVEGTPRQIETFRTQLVERLPAAARIDRVERHESRPAGRSGFEIESGSTPGPISAAVPADVAVCRNCLADVGDAENRRHAYPMTSCTSCGPRYSIIRSMPYERGDTVMERFDLCSACHREYESAGDRRCHAQTICCADCGPNVWAVDRDGRSFGDAVAAIEIAIKALRSGQIVALRGVGGYQLLVDATNQSAVERLRQRKRRRAKPLAVMVRDDEAAERLAYFSDEERRQLLDPANPIVVVQARDRSSLAPSVHAGFSTVGIMLPTTPLHWQLLTGAGRPFVATSGNLEGRPLVFQTDEAESELAGVADLFVHHNRPIERPIDDSVVRVIAGRPVTLRLARGLAPLELDVAADDETAVLAVGGHMKVAAALANTRQAVLAPHVGELEDLATRQRYLDHLQQLYSLYGTRPEHIAHDLHPDYFTTRWAAEQRVPLTAVGHHHAHVVAGMAEHGWLDREVLGVSFDGTGYGPDGTIWGGEFLLSTCTDFRRVAHVRPFRLPGGERAVREPWRVAFSLIRDAVGASSAAKWLGSHHLENAGSIRLLSDALSNDQFSPVTTSAGRLFDAVAAIVLSIRRVDFDGEAAMRLEDACDLSASGSYPLPLRDGPVVHLDWRPLVARLLEDRADDATPGEMAMRFHRALAAAIIGICDRRPQHPAVLGGGVFQNRVLVELIASGWNGRHDQLGLPGRIPPGDGGLAAGQLAVALARTRKREQERCV